MQIMLEKGWTTDTIERILVNYTKRGKVDPRDFSEMFLLFAIKRKLKLMSHMINNDDLPFEFK